jgi:NADH:ubiquinone oxidoreductase 27 kD subunit
MSNEELKQHITNASFDETGEWLNVLIDAPAWRQLALDLRRLEYDSMFCCTCVDWKTHFTMVYHLTSTVHRHTVVIKAKVDRAKPEIETVCDIWRTAEFLEREVYDLFGVRFLNHPDLRRLVLTEDFVGHPLRKDFEDPINMIKL